MPESFLDLYNRAIKKGKCSVCGTCIISCPKNLLAFREEVFIAPKQH